MAKTKEQKVNVIRIAQKDLGKTKIEVKTGEKTVIVITTPPIEFSK